MSPGELERLANQAAEHDWSGRGRPDWFAEHRAEVKDVYLTFLSEETNEVLRCSTTVVLRDGTGGHFSLDIAKTEFERLRDVGDEVLVDLAHRFLYAFPNIPLDAPQQEAWDQAYEKTKPSLRPEDGSR
ncbi:hypothetical protein [Herbidospora mongoliensis]|uniref:hypothetical protein n=1 Tax=Herbidospora mongoliensis TaxID=688067 RepID=UPI001C3F228F|nr:hypothetical protein [Herbidospora mongoliensis]